MSPIPPEMLTPAELESLRREGKEALAYARAELARNPLQEKPSASEMLTEAEKEALRREAREAGDWMREELRRNPALPPDETGEDKRDSE